MGTYLVDTRDKVAQAVTPAADEPIEPRFVKVTADNFSEAFRLAGVGPDGGQPARASALPSEEDECENPADSQNDSPRP